jgi:hypothetical protein
MKVQEAAGKMTRPVTLRVYSTGACDRFETNLVNVARQIAGVASKVVEFEETESPLLPGKPSISLAAGDVCNIHYLAAPEGPELDPFLDALVWLSSAAVEPRSAAIESLGRLHEPVDLLALIAPVCPHCPGLVCKVLSFAAAQPLVAVTVADAVQFPDLAEKYRVRSTPTLIINGYGTLVGQVSEDRIVRLILGGDDEFPLTPVFESMITAGRAEDAAVLLSQCDQPKAILPVYTGPQFAVRVGALVTMEEALDRDPRCLDPIVEDLCALLAHEEVALRGDTAQLLGKIGNPAALPSLERAVKDPDPEVREAAEEAIAILKS